MFCLLNHQFNFSETKWFGDRFSILCLRQGPLTDFVPREAEIDMSVH